MHNLDLALIWLGFFAAIFLGWYFFLQARNKERMALIERDKDVSEIYAKRDREFRFRFPWLKLGMLITGIGFGFSTVTIMMMLDKAWADFVNRTDGMIVFAAILLFGGLSMVIAHYLDKPKKQ